MLQFILGPAGSGKTECIYQDIDARLRAGLRSWILVPEQFSLFTEKELIRRFGLPAQTRIKVLSFSRLCNLVLHQAGPLRMRYIDGAGKQIIAAQTLELLQGKLAVLGRNLRQKGFGQVLVQTISECKRYGVPPQGLRFAAEHTKEPELAAKLEDLALLYETYNGLIEAQSADAEDNLALICPRLRSCEFLTGKLYIQHFRSFTPIEHRALGELMHRFDLCAALDYSDAAAFSGLFAPVGGTIRRLRETAETEGIAEAEPIVLPGPSEESPLGYLRGRYFDARALPFAGNHGDAAGIYEVQNHCREIECAADLILRLCRTEGFRFSDFLILARDTASYTRILPAIFERRGIRVFLDARRSIASKPLIRLISGTLEILAYGPSYERVMAIARTGLFDLTRDAVDELENYILATAPSHAMWQAETWDYVPGRGRYDMEKINRARDVLLSGVRAVQNEITGTKTGGELCAALLDWMKQSGLSQQVIDRARACAAAGKPELADEYQQVWNAAVSVLAQISAVMARVPMTYRRFFELFEGACTGIEIGLTPQTIDCVVFSQIDRFRSSGSKVVLVLDMNEGVFPRGYMSEGLLSDSERRELERLGVELAPGMEQKRREEQLLIYAVLSAPRERLYFFRPLLDQEGKPQQGSGILKRIRELFPAIAAVNPDAGEDPLSGTEGRAGAFDLLAAALAEAGGDPELLPRPLRELYGWFCQDSAYQPRLRALREAMSAGPPETLSPDMVKELYGLPLSLSASQLEAYNACAFQYFLTYGLLVREREQAGVEPRGMGSVQHAALYDYFTELRDSGADFSAISREDCCRRVGEAVEREARKNAELLYETSAYYQYIVMRMKGIAARTAWEVVKFYRSSNFRPYGFEITIGTKGDIPALSVRIDGEEIARIRGIIDRADTTELDGETLVSVIDYKSSAKGLDVELVRDGITLQPLLYTDAVCRQLPNAVPAAMVYLQMNDPILDESKVKGNLELAVNKEMAPRGWIADDAEIISAYTGTPGEDACSYLPAGTAAMVSREELQARIQSANEKIREAAVGIAGGRIGARPYQSYKHDACQYCLYGPVCHAAENGTASAAKS